MNTFAFSNILYVYNCLATISEHPVGNYTINVEMFFWKCNLPHVRHLVGWTGRVEELHFQRSNQSTCFLLMACFHVCKQTKVGEPAKDKDLVLITSSLMRALSQASFSVVQFWEGAGGGDKKYKQNMAKRAGIINISNQV